MRILYLGNNRVGLEVLRHLVDLGEHLVGLVIHPEDKQRFGREIVETVGLPEDRIFLGNRLRDPEVVDAIRSLRADLGLSVLFGYILRPEFLDLFPRGVVNLHPSYLPFNRGQYPNVWSIIEKTPAGATLHFIDPGIDTGDIIEQRRIEVEPIDTGESLYSKLESCCVELFRTAWPSIRGGNAPRRPQPLHEGSFHRTRDVAGIDLIDLDQSTTAHDLINLLRARTFPPHRGAYFIENGRRVGLRLSLEYEDDDD